MFFSGVETFDFSKDPQLSKWKKSDFLIACLLWTTQSFFAMPLHLVVPVCILVFLILAAEGRIVQRPQFWWFLVILLLTSMNMLIGMTCFNVYPESKIYYIPRLLFFPMVFLIGCSISPRSIKYFIYIILFEYCIALLQRFNLFPIFAVIDRYEDAEQLYLQRTPGFSYGYGALGFRWYFLLLLFFGFYEKYKALIVPRKIFFIGMAIGLMVSFNRTAFVALPVFFLFYFLRYEKIKKFLTHLNVTIAVAALTTLIFMIPFIFEFVQKELLRDAVDMNSASSGRLEIYEAAWNFIKENPVFGIFSNRYHDLSSRGVDQAHNSYLQCMADHGIPIFLLVMCIYISLVNRKNLPYAMSIAAFSMLNYLAFWGCSDYDILIFYMLTQFLPPLKGKMLKTTNAADVPCDLSKMGDPGLEN